MKVFLSDLHLGRGDELEDFLLWDDNALPLAKKPQTIIKGMSRMHNAFSRFIDFILKLGKTRRVNPEIILLGDAFDLLQTLPEQRDNPDKIDLIASAHQPFFDSLIRFHKNGGQVNLILGNHDHDLLYPILFDRLRSVLPFLNPATNGAPALFYYDPRAGVYAEHGNQFDALNAFKNPFNPDETPIGAELLIQLVNPLERLCPVIDNLGVRESLWFLARHAPEILSEAHKKDMLLLKTVQDLSRENRLKHLAYFLVHQITPANRDSILDILWKTLYANEEILRNAAAPKHLLRGVLYTFAAFGRNPLKIFQGLLGDRLFDAAKKIARGDIGFAIKKPDNNPNFVLFGHTHKPRANRITKGARYVNTGSWKMRASPKGKRSLQMEQSLDFALLLQEEKKNWRVSLNSWAKMSDHATM